LKKVYGDEIRIPSPALVLESRSAVKNIFSFLSAKDKPRERFYLLPGQSGRAYRRKQQFILKCSLAVGVIVSALFALALWLKYRSIH
jgi:hypothetical protein